MLEGFCCQEMADVPISPDRRCLADGSLVLPPSTACPHQRLVDGTWTICTCKPIAAGTWRKILSQQAKVVEKRDRDRAAQQFSAKALKPPKLATARKSKIPKRLIDRATFVCQECGVQGRRLATRTICDTCYQMRKRRAKGLHPASNIRLPEIPCPVCGTPFRSISYGAGKRKQTCSFTCGQVKQAAANRQRAKRAS